MTESLPPTGAKRWTSALELDSSRRVSGGSPEALRRAIDRGADLRIQTDFYFHEHLEPGSGNQELVREVSEFGTTFLIEKRWAAGVMTRRMPINSFAGFGPRASMSYFLYNEDGGQAIGRVYLDGPPRQGNIGRSPGGEFQEMAKYHESDCWDADTNAPSSNFIYDFELFRFYVSDTWQEVYAHDENGQPNGGRLQDLTDAFVEGAEIKVGISGLNSRLSEDGPAHEQFIQAGPGYFHTETGLFYAGTHPSVFIAPAVPMRYCSKNWDFGNLVPRTDGLVYRWICNPYTLQFEKSEGHHPIRWFVRL